MYNIVEYFGKLLCDAQSAIGTVIFDDDDLHIDIAKHWITGTA